MGNAAVTCDELRSGLKVVRMHRPNWPVLTADVWVATGSVHESPDQAGVSHFLEHMMFKGTPTRTAGELDRLVEGVGGHWNAGTSKDFTHYYLTVPSEHRALALDALADAVIRSVINPEHVESERKVILEEWRRSEDNPQQALWTRLYETVHPSGNYRWPVLGHRSTIEALTRDQLAAYHAGRYRPERMTLLLCGPVEDDAVLEEIEEHFRWENGAPDLRAPKPEKTEWGDGAIHIVSREISESHLAVAWPAPAASDTKGMLAMDVAQFILGQGRASRLYQRLHEQERLVTTIGLTYPPHVEEGLFIVIATCQPDKVQRAQEIIVEEVAGLAERKPRADEARRAKRLLTNQHIFSRETTTGQTASMGYHLILTGDLEFDEKYIDLMNRVTVPAITKAAQEWLSPERAVTVVVQPKDHPLEWEGATEEVPR